MVNDGTSTINGGYGISRSELTIGHLVTGDIDIDHHHRVQFLGTTHEMWI